MIYTSPTGSFDNERPDLTSNDAGQLAKVQIENSLALGWKKEDILLYTNFEFQYGDFKAKVLKDVDFFERKPQASKINAIIRLFENRTIRKGEMYWFHDLDAFQLEAITEDEIDISDNEVAVTEYGSLSFAGERRISTGVIFFKSGSKDIFVRIKELAYRKRIDEEEALGLLIIGDENIRKRVKKINHSYNFIGYNLRTYYRRAIKPLKVVHFHPLAGNRRLKTENSLRFFMGENKINTPLITERLIKIFKFHRIRPLETNSVAIFIPTYKRADRLLKVYKNAKESSPLISAVYFILEKDDQESIDILKTNKISYIINERSKNYAGAINTAYLKTSEKYFFHGADDLDFKPGWLEKCLEKMVNPIKVVGTNDLHNPEVLKQQHSTHNLVDRDYIKEYSGVFDVPNLILSENYLHNWIDREFVEVAKMRGVWAPCLEAVVEHLHYGWGLSEKDETYAKQEGSWGRDANLFRKRRSLFIEAIKAEHSKSI